ncbi:hypothetical protein ZHAS_00011644 [Anopheles sinensis]|uniref:Uncharacterized protein n=1 Tax=Anopheles sinensis TaxID=74873 RepID=A0A084W0Q9_ANOSI|nr:hypothetical protein ZHAS_00011644 [Anopheles sinensis]
MQMRISHRPVETVEPGCKDGALDVRQHKTEGTGQSGRKNGNGIAPPELASVLCIGRLKTNDKSEPRQSQSTWTDFANLENRSDTTRPFPRQENVGWETVRQWVEVRFRRGFVFATLETSTYGVMSGH